MASPLPFASPIRQNASLIHIPPPTNSGAENESETARSAEGDDDSATSSPIAAAFDQRHNKAK